MAEIAAPSEGSPAATEAPSPPSAAPVAEASASPAPAQQPPPPAPAIPGNRTLGPLAFISQTINNCGPASIAEVLQFWGVQRTQEQVQAVLRGPDDTFGMLAGGVPDYARALGMESLMSAGGTPEMVKALVAAGIPPIVNQMVSLQDHTFHFRPISGYDDAKKAFISSDPYLGANYTIGYDEFSDVWAPSNGFFMVIYPPDKRDQLVQALSLAGWDQATAEAAVSSRPRSPLLANAAPPVTAAQLSLAAQKSTDLALLQPGGRARPASSPQPQPQRFTGPISIALSATDPGGFGIAYITYALDAGPQQSYRRPVAVQQAGPHTLQFHAVDYAGYIEPTRSVDFTIGTASAPTTVADLSGSSGANGWIKAGDPVTLKLSSTSLDQQPITSTTYSVNGGASQAYGGPIPFNDGSYTVTYSSIGQAGIAEAPHTLSFKVDQTAPSLTVSGVNQGASYVLGSVPTPSFQASDAGSGIDKQAASLKTPPAGIGTYSYTVTAVDKAGNSAQTTVSYSAGYGVCPRFDAGQPFKMGTIFDIKVQLCDATKKNLSSPAIPLTVLSLTGPAGKANPGAFTYQPADSSYTLTLSGRTMPAGQYKLSFTAAGDPVQHDLTFTVG